MHGVIPVCHTRKIITENVLEKSWKMIARKESEPDSDALSQSAHFCIEYNLTVVLPVLQKQIIFDLPLETVKTVSYTVDGTFITINVLKKQDKHRQQKNSCRCC